MIVASSYPFLDVMWTMIVFFAWVIWFWMLITVLSDVFRRHDISGWGKAGWTIFVIFLPFIGVLSYLIAQSGGMADRSTQAAQTSQAQTDEYIRSVAAQSDPAEQIARAKELLDSGAISATEYDALKQKALGT
ncbi:MAG TPA: SHOCT domain-containing protein [Gaiellaceae bacterium]